MSFSNCKLYIVLSTKQGLGKQSWFAVSLESRVLWPHNLGHTCGSVLGHSPTVWSTHTSKMSVNKPQIVTPDDCSEIHVSTSMRWVYIWIGVEGRALLASCIDWGGGAGERPVVPITEACCINECLMLTLMFLFGCRREERGESFLNARCTSHIVHLLFLSV